MNMKNTTARNLVILGAGGFAREVAWLVSEINRAETGSWNLVGFWEHDGDRLGHHINGLPTVGIDLVSQYLPHLYAVVAIGNPQIRRRAVHEAETLGCQFATLVHPDVRYDHQSVRFGPGTIICAGSILTVNVTIGAHVIVNLDCTIGHDSILKDYVTISPGCHLSGYTIVQEGAYLGTGAVTVERHEIGARSIVGAGAVVVKDIPPDVTAIGVPARVKES